MTELSKELKFKINQFRSNFLSKSEVFIFEENNFDIALSKIFNTFSYIFLPTIKICKKILMKILDKILEFGIQQNDLKKRILKQDEILNNNLKLNAALSEQISQLNNKIDNLSSKKDNSEGLEKDKLLNINNPKTSNIEIDFYQKENLRISNELFETQKKFEIIKTEIEKFQNQRSNLIEKINSVNDVIQDSNIVTNVFVENKKNKIHIRDPEKINNNQKLDLNTEIEKIFSKK